MPATNPENATVSRKAFPPPKLIETLPIHCLLSCLIQPSASSDRVQPGHEFAISKASNLFNRQILCPFVLVTTRYPKLRQLFTRHKVLTLEQCIPAQDTIHIPVLCATDFLHRRSPVSRRYKLRKPAHWFVEIMGNSGSIDLVEEPWMLPIMVAFITFLAFLAV